jgi:Fe-S oxidoreductase
MYGQAFFLKRCYLNYEKEIVSCAALYMASKNEYFKLKLSDFLLNYHKTKLAGKLLYSLKIMQLRDNFSNQCPTNRKMN